MLRRINNSYKKKTWYLLIANNVSKTLYRCVETMLLTQLPKKKKILAFSSQRIPIKPSTSGR